MPEPSKKIKRMLREWLAKAYEREMHRELVQLDANMAEWRKGAISSGEMSQRIHDWEEGPVRALYKYYNNGTNASVVANAVVTGILDEKEVPPELLEAMKASLSYFRDMKKEGELLIREGDWWNAK